MNYLAGPLTRAQIPDINHWWEQLSPPPGPSPTTIEPNLSLRHLRRRNPFPTSTRSVSPLVQLQQSPGPQGSRRDRCPPNVQSPIFSLHTARSAAAIDEYFLPNNLTFIQAFQAAGQSYPEQTFSNGMIYRPVLLGQAAVRFLNRRYNLDYELHRTAMVGTWAARSSALGEFPSRWVDARELDSQPDPKARFAGPGGPLMTAGRMAELQKDFLDWAFHNSQAKVRANEDTGFMRGRKSHRPISAPVRGFARQGRDAETEKTPADMIKNWLYCRKMHRQQRELEEDQAEQSQRKMEEFGTNIENVLGLFGGRRSSRHLCSSLSKHRLTQQAKADVGKSADEIAELKKGIAALQEERAQALEAANQRWGEVANRVTEIKVAPLKKDVSLRPLGVAWLPVHLAQVGDGTVELPGYTGGEG